MTIALHKVSAERRAEEDRIVLLRLLRSPATLEQLKDDLACRVSDRLSHILDRLQRAVAGRPVLVARSGKPRAVYSLTDEGKALAVQLRERRAA